MKNKINSPELGSVVRRTSWKFEDNPKYPCDVLIIDGKYMSSGRISNFWRWRRISPDGTLSPDIESGYGDFVESDKKYQVSTEIVVTVDEQPTTPPDPITLGESQFEVGDDVLVQGKVVKLNEKHQQMEILVNGTKDFKLNLKTNGMAYTHATDRCVLKVDKNSSPEPTFRSGQRIVDMETGTKYILAVVGVSPNLTPKVNAISLSTGNRWLDSIPVNDSDNITLEEFRSITKGMNVEIV